MAWIENMCKQKHESFYSRILANFIDNDILKYSSFSH